jgi:hypothetical protein
MMSDTELKWLAEHAKKSKVIIELGSWIGRSARALADNMPEDAVLYCVDTWLGSEAERQGYMNVVSQMNGDFAAYHCITNLWDHISKGRVRPIRMHGRNAAQMFREQGLKADLIFIDAGHIFHEVKEDIACFLPILAKDGILCGHDFNQPAWPDVTRAVREYFPQVKNVDTIWAVESPPPSIFDCFTFNNELDLLEKRLSIMHDAVDRFVLVEATVTHSGKPKSLVFNANLDLFQKYLNKITYVVVEDSPVFDGSEASAWAIEQHQRNAIMRALTDCRDDYLIIVSDLDEIPNPAAIHSLNGNEIASLEMELLLYDGKVRSLDPWLHAKILTYRKLKELTPCGARYAHEHSDLAKIPDGGQHLSWTGGVDSIIEKIHNTAHRNIDTDRFTDRAHIQNCIDKGLDLFDRDIKYEVVR